MMKRVKWTGYQSSANPNNWVGVVATEFGLRVVTSDSLENLRMDIAMMVHMLHNGDDCAQKETIYQETMDVEINFGGDPSAN